MKCKNETCNKEFEPKTSKQIFCSDNCKKQWHRKHAKVAVGQPSPESEQEITRLKAEIDRLNKEILSLKDDIQCWKTSYRELESRPMPRSYNALMQAKVACNDKDEWEVLQKEILQNDFLREDQKIRLLGPVQTTYGMG